MADKKRNNSDNNKSKKKSKKNNKKGFKVFKILLVIFLMTGFIVAGALGGLVIAIAKDAPEVDTNRLLSSLNESSKILDQNGNVIERIHGDEYRQVVTLDKIPKHVQDAFVSIEDERFEEHKGVDPKRIIGALWADIKAGAAVQGASTITQQLVKNMYLLEEVDRHNLLNDISRKIKEAYLAIKIERQLTKDQILEAYLNRIYLGQGAYGVQAAATTYFSKDVSELTISEAATLAGVTKSPHNFALYKSIRPENLEDNNPNFLGYVYKDGHKYGAVFNNNERILERRNIALNKMQELNFITQEEYEDARAQDIKEAMNPYNEDIITDISSYFADYVRDQVIKSLVNEKGYSKQKAEELLYTGGLNIYSTVDINMQNRIEAVYENFENILREVDSKSSPMGIKSSAFRNGNIVNQYGKVLYFKKNTILNEESDLIINKGTYSLSDNGNLIINSSKLDLFSTRVDVIDYYAINKNDNLVTYTLGDLALNKNDFTVEDKKLVIKSNYLKSNKDFYSIDSNDNLIINKNYFYHNTSGIVQPQSSTIIIDYKTGHIKALVGGRDIEGRKIYNRATVATRQPGSAMKPLAVYLPAIDNGYTAASIIDDIPFYYKGKRWPSNWYEKSDYRSTGYRGLYTLRESVEQSVNVNAVKLIEKIGVNTAIEYLDTMGIKSLVTRDENKRYNDEQLSLALGGMTQGVTNLEITAAYGTIANNGVYSSPIAFTKVVDNEGNVLIENDPIRNRVVDPQVSYMMTDILRSTVEDGLGRRAIFDNANNKKIPAAGKTGTTQNQGDAWFVGYSPYYTAGVWIGNDINEIKMGEGSAVAAHLWKYIMKAAHENLETKDFDVADGLTSRQICIDSGKLSTDLCKLDPRGSRVRTETFIKGTEPKEYCDIHVEAEIDISTGKLANEYCPEDLVETRVFIKRDPPYNPEENDNIIPRDYQYEVPTEVCEEHTESESWKDFLWDNFFNNGDDEENDEGENPNPNSETDEENNIIDSNDGEDENTEENNNEEESDNQ